MQKNKAVFRLCFIVKVVESGIKNRSAISKEKKSHLKGENF